MSNINFCLITTALLFSLAGVVSGQELDSVDLPKSGQTVTGIESQNELWKRYVELTMCEGGQLIVGENLYEGSSDCLVLSPENGAFFFSTMISGSEQVFGSVRIDGDDLPACEFYLNVVGYDTGFRVDSGIAPPGKQTSLIAFNISGVSAKANEDGSAIILSDANVTWVAYGDDGLSQAVLREAIFQKGVKKQLGPNEILIPYGGSKISDAIADLEELGRVCTELF